MCVFVHFGSYCLERREQDVQKDSRIWFRRFVNPLQITVAYFSSPRRSPLWNSSSEAIAPRWRILDVITSICWLFYSHCEVTRCLHLTSPRNGQLPRIHQSLETRNFDSPNLVEILLFDNSEESTNLLVWLIGVYILRCVRVAPSVPFSVVFQKCQVHSI